MTNMADDNVAVVRDKDGRRYYAARESKFVREGLAEGRLTEVPNANTSNASAGGRRDSGRRGGGSSDGKSAAGSADVHAG